VAEPQKQWTWGRERLTQTVVCRLSVRQRLRVVEAAVREGVGTTEIVRRALLRGLDVIEGAKPGGDQ